MNAPLGACRPDTVRPGLAGHDEDTELDAHPEAEPGRSAGLPLILQTALRSYKLILATLVVVLLGTGFWLTRQTRIYEARMTIKIEPRAMRPLGRDVQTPGENTSNYWVDQEYYATQYKLIESRRTAEQVVRTLGLDKDRTFPAFVKPGTQVEPPESPITVEKAAATLLSRLTVLPVKKSRLVELKFEDADPERARRILSTLADAYMEQTLETSMTDISSASTWLQDQLGKLKGELESNEIKLHDFKKDKRLLSVSLDDQSNMLAGEMEQLNRALTEAKTKRAKLAARVAQLGQIDRNDPSRLPATELLESPTLKELRARFLNAESDLSSMKSAGRGENHPEVLSATTTTQGARAALLEEIANILEASKRDLAAADQEIGSLAGLYANAEQRAFDLNLLEIEYKRLARAKENTERLHTIVLERSKESELSTQMRFNNVSVIDRALTPTVPIRPRTGLTLGLGALGGALLGLGLVVLRERLDRRIRGSEDAEALLGLTCLGTIPEAAKVPGPTRVSLAPTRRARSATSSAEGSESPELWVHKFPTSAFAEAIRALRTNLLFSSPDRPYRTILVTSASPTDGKTTVATSLAISLARTGKSVLLIDADLRKPRLSRVFSLGQESQGVTSVVLEPEFFASAIRRTDIENLAVLPTGTLPPNPAELLHSVAFERLLTVASENFERVVIDSPPLVAVTDAAILSRFVDTTLLVTRSGSTRKDHAKKAARALRDVGSKVAGMVLNGVSTSAGAYGYYEYYGGSGDEHPKGGGPTTA